MSKNAVFKNAVFKNAVFKNAVLKDAVPIGKACLDYSRYFAIL